MPYANSDYTILKTVTVAAAPTNTPAILATGNSDSYVDVLVRNTGVNLLKLAVEPVAVQSTNDSADVFELPVGQSETIPLAPGQKLYAVGVGGGGRASVSRSIGLRNLLDALNLLVARCAGPAES